jgi:two-component system nitrate/nitrite response regulator NarL
MSAGADPVRVFVADDHPMFRASVARAVQMHPLLTLSGEAEDGRSALDAIRELCPDVAVVDLRMPGLDGSQIAEAVRNESLTTRIVLLSGHLQGDAVYDALQRGASGVLSKLADSSSLTDAILAVARGQTVIAPEIQDAVATAIQMRSRNDQPPLTEREREVLAGVADGGSVASIAVALHLSPSTVKTHLEHLYRKLGVSDRAAAVAEAMRRGVLH